MFLFQFIEKEMLHNRKFFDAMNKLQWGLLFVLRLNKVLTN